MNKSQFIKSAMENFPEASRGNGLVCESWNYKNMKFRFFDEETGKSHEVNKKMLREGLKKLLRIIKDGKYFNNGVGPHLLSDGYDSDAQDYDALVQCAIFDEVIYG